MIRKSESDEFPLAAEYTEARIVAILDDFKVEEHTLSNQGRAKLKKSLENESNRVRVLLGMWRGRWKTDIFMLDKEIIYRRLKEWGALKK